ncbi:MAG TPA: POTRA domain-containing protein [Chryseosolibacter sp.]|nr:POTRA domain-containing protein [Chryseosolibacter sp.]
MKRILLIAMLLCVAFDTWSQFRRGRERESQPATEEGTLNYANPAEYTIAGIDVTGIEILDENAMISISGLKIGDKIKIPGDDISNAIRKIWKYGLVGDISILVDRIEGSNIYLIIELAERSRLNAFYFTGVTKAQESGLKEDLNLIRGKIVNDAMVRNTELAVKKYFVKKGFLNTEVKVVQELDTLNDGIKLRIHVEPNSKVKINEINFHGNEQIADAALKKRLKKTKEHPRFTLHRTLLETIVKPKKYVGEPYEVSWREVKEFLNDNVKLNVFASSKFLPEEYEEDKQRIIDYYNSKGYRDAEIVEDTLYKHNNRTVNIDFKIYEGPKYYFRNILWSGNFVYTDKQLDAVLGIAKGDVYNKELIQRKLNFNPKGMDISGLYMDDGYLFFRINDVEVAVAGDSIDVEMRIFEGEQATIDQVTITGNDRTSDHVIRRELMTVPGEKFRRSDIIRTQQSLSQLGYFAPEKVNPNLQPNQEDGTVDIEWQVEEQSNDQIELSGGWGGYYGFVGTLGLTFNNFSLRNIPNIKNWKPLPVGDGQRLQLRVQANGRQYQSYSFSFTEPWLGGRKPHSLTVSLNSSVQRSLFGFGYAPLPDPTEDTPTLKVNSITVGLGRRLEWPDNYFTLTNSVSLLKYTLNNWFSGGLGFTDGDANSFTFNTTLSRRSVNEIMYPSQGSEISLSLTLTPPHSMWRDLDYATASNADKFAWIEFHKWMFDAKYYLPLDSKKKLVIEAKAHFGFIGSYTDKAGIGPFERFFLGGDGLAGGFNSFLLGQEIIGLRGYENNKVTPPLYDRYGNVGIGNAVQGGIVYDKLGLELRYPVTTGSAATIYGFGFVEAGNNWASYEDFNPFELYKSAGFGARIFMPAFGLIGLNWAYGFDTLPYATKPSGSQFHFTIGQQIR